MSCIRKTFSVEKEGDNLYKWSLALRRIIYYKTERSAQMDFKYSPEEEAFRDEFVSWLEGVLAEKGDGPPFKLHDALDDRVAWYREFQKKLFDAGYAGITWPKEYGGRGGTVIESFIVDEAIQKRAAVENFNAIGFGMAGGVILAFGTEEQKQRYIPAMLNGSEIWCQGFSEPNAGSDLAGLSSKGVKDGDDYVINGQKVWTSMAHVADQCILVVRTDPDVPKHKGLSFFILDMKTPGVEIRPVVQITGEAEFNEVYFDDVRIPRTQMLGNENDGWKISIATLMFERYAVSQYGSFRRSIDGMFDMAQRVTRNGKPAIEDPLIRQKLAQYHIEVEILKFNTLRSRGKMVKGEVPGPEGSIEKLYWSEMNKAMQEFAMELEGPYHQLMQSSKWSLAEGIYQYAFLRSRANTIEAGTSEIQKNIIGERVLGLPKDAARAALAKK
jgi:alkylation response protein AidB-like acyl-CoA dehydrogenase